MRRCNKCNGELKFNKTPNNIHYGRFDCINCGKWDSWVKNPEKQGRNRTSRHNIKQVMKFHKKTKIFCFFCLREENELGLHETFTIDHIEELKEKGKDEIENLQVLCSACHKLKNWVGLYVNKHLKKYYQNYHKRQVGDKGKKPETEEFPRH